MPNRILKESICTSGNIEALSEGAEILFYRLLVNCDDYGLLDARLPIIRAKCFPLRLDRVTDHDVAVWLEELQAAGLVDGYTVDGLPYLHVLSWAKHQQVRTQRARYPSPAEGEPYAFAEVEHNCAQLKSIASNCALNPNPIRIQSEAESFGAAEAARKPQPREKSVFQHENQQFWEALKKAHEYEPQNSVERGGWNKAIMLLRQAGVTPEEYGALHDAYLGMYPNLSGRITPNAIAKSVGAIKAFRERPTQRDRPGRNGSSMADDFARIDAVAAMVERGGSFFGHSPGGHPEGAEGGIPGQAPT